MNQDNPFDSIPNLETALGWFTVDVLKDLLYVVSGARHAGRKAELIRELEKYLSGEKLTALWHSLDNTQQLAVAETIYSGNQSFESDRFHAKYGMLPLFSIKTETRGTHQTPSRLRMFLYRDSRYGGSDWIVPQDLAERLLTFVPKPRAVTLAHVDQLPQHCGHIEKYDEWDEDDAEGAAEVESSSQETPYVCRATERDALTELGIVLRLIDLGKLSVSEKTFLPGASSLRELAGSLAGGDFYEPDSAPSSNSDEKIGPIKAFAWLLLVQAAGLSELHGKKLVLTKSGRSALGKDAAETLRLIWQRWIKNRKFDEFNRIDVIKGQHGKGARSLSAPANRRAVIHSALCECPRGSWIAFEDFSRYLVAAGHHFEITRDPWTLYIIDSNYGSLGYAGSHGWSILQKRYLSCVLFEYAATLGLIDVAYVEPWKVVLDCGDLWGTDDMPYLSRYDGLLWFRVNPLGAYCMGIESDYEISTPAPQTTLRILPSLQIQVVSGALTTEESLFLESWAQCEDSDLWRLDRGKILKALESGRNIDELKEFLVARDPQGLPDLVEGLLAGSARQARALRCVGSVLLVECADSAIAELIAGNQLTQSLCKPAGPKYLIVKIEDEERFRKAVNALGYGMPKL